MFFVFYRTPHLSRALGKCQTGGWAQGWGAAQEGGRNRWEMEGSPPGAARVKPLGSQEKNKLSPEILSSTSDADSLVGVFSAHMAPSAK